MGDSSDQYQSEVIGAQDINDDFQSNSDLEKNVSGVHKEIETYLPEALHQNKENSRNNFTLDIGQDPTGDTQDENQPVIKQWVNVDEYLKKQAQGRVFEQIEEEPSVEPTPTASVIIETPGIEELTKNTLAYFGFPEV